jgi:signal transduction histidine kinase
MRDRVAAFGGTFAVRSDRGAIVEAVFPVEGEAAP